MSDPLETYSTDLLNGMWIARSSVLVALEGSLHGNANSSQVPAAQKQRLTKPQKLRAHTNNISPLSFFFEINVCFGQRTSPDEVGQPWDRMRRTLG